MPYSIISSAREQRWQDTPISSRQARSGVYGCGLIGSCLRDQPYSDVERKVRPDPAEHDRKPIAYADQKKDVDGAPKPPCRRTGDLHPSKIRNRTPAADRGQAALVAIAERWRRLATAHPGS